MGNPMAALHEKLESGAQGPLTGLKVVEFASIGPGPFAAMMLADMGAEVVRVSRPGSPTWKPEDFVRRGRTELQLDLKKPEDVQTAAELAGAADVVLEGNRPGVMERLGLGPDVLLASNPRLVYGRMTGWVNLVRCRPSRAMILTTLRYPALCIVLVQPHAHTRR